VASGDPRPGAVVLWTRVTPDPTATPGSGVGPAVDVDWEVASTEDFADVVAHGTVGTGPERDHTVRVDATGLAAATPYWFRFRWGEAHSPVGRTATAPAEDAAVARLTVGVVSCADLQVGWFAAYRHLAARRDLDLVVHLGDYLYEYAPPDATSGIPGVRRHDPPQEAVHLADYRRRHAQYKTDPDLQALHAAVPWVVTWDDHETANNAWSGGAANHQPVTEGDWTDRRAAARQAYAEWMPVGAAPDGPLYRRLRWGALAGLSMLDLRSYRDRAVTGAGDPTLEDPGRTLIGPAQEAFLLRFLSDDSVRWKLVGNPVMFAPVRYPDTLDPAVSAALAALFGIPADRPVVLNPDQWDGYPAARARVLRHLTAGRIRNAVFLTGDMHSGWAAEIPADAADVTDRAAPSAPGGRSVGVELVCASVTSSNLGDALGPGAVLEAADAAVRAANPHVRYVDLAAHGYSVLEVTPERVQMDWFRLVDRADPHSAAVPAASWAVSDGRTTLRRADPLG
jgi:alkaline phosphatase D